MHDLLGLQSCQPLCTITAAKELGLVESSLRQHLHCWKEMLQSHPDVQFRDFVLAGISQGFRVGFDWSSPLSSASKNIPSASEHPQEVQEYIHKEVCKGNFIGPLPSSQLSNGQSLQINSIGVVPKGHTPDRWRIITDLSFPHGRSVNDRIAGGMCSLEYTTVDKVAGSALALGRGTLLAKIDIKSAYRLISVHPEDRPLLGLQWQGSVYIDRKLPFGLRSAPKIFNCVADALEWCFRQAGVSNIDHYLDDFITFGPPGSATCSCNLEIIKSVSEKLGVPLASEKEEGPTTRITFLGIQIDTVEGVLALPNEKRLRIQQELTRWEGRRWCKRRELESLIGLLHHATQVVRPGRSFLHRLISHLRGGRHSNHHIRLNKEARADIQWWRIFLDTWNGVSLVPISRPVAHLTSDALGAWGCGAYSDSQWFQFQWTDACGSRSIAFKELLPIVLAISAWGPMWRGYLVQCRCDNEAVVHILASRYAKCNDLMHLLRCLFFFEAYYQLHVTAVHVPGILNTLADDLSRDRVSSFLLQAPNMPTHPAPLPLMATDLLLDPAMDWSSSTWIRLFASILH